MSWTANEERYQAEYRGESIDDPRPAPEAEDPTGLAIVALAAVVDRLVCKAQLPMGTQPAPVAECECHDCETARVLCAAIERLEAA
jgi:hypothetical protein